MFINYIMTENVIIFKPEQLLEQDFDLSVISNVDDLKKRFFPTVFWEEIRVKKNKGSYNNIIKFFNEETNEKSVLRINKKPSFMFEKGIFYHLKDYNINEHNRSLFNWTNASKHGICPKLKYWGFVKGTMDEETEQTFIYQCIITELYSMDLGDFCKDLYSKLKTQEIQPIEIEIQKQLTNLINKLSKDPFYMVCFDIKPSNCVINISPEILNTNSQTLNEDSIKLIDLDSDFCKGFDFLEKSNLNHHIQDMTALLQNMMMSNYFYTFYKRNIFYQYFESQKEVMQKNYQSLKVLFCKKYDYYNYKKYIFYDEGDKISVIPKPEKPMFRKTRKRLSKFTGMHEVIRKSINPERITIVPEASKYFEETSLHYLFPEKKRKSTIKNCNELFDILFERCFIFSPKGDVYHSNTRGGKKKKSTKRKTKKSKVNK